MTVPCFLQVQRALRLCPLVGQFAHHSRSRVGICGPSANLFKYSCAGIGPRLLVHDAQDAAGTYAALEHAVALHGTFVKGCFAIFLLWCWARYCSGGVALRTMVRSSWTLRGLDLSRSTLLRTPRTLKWLLVSLRPRGDGNVLRLAQDASEACAWLLQSVQVRSWWYVGRYAVSGIIAKEFNDAKIILSARRALLTSFYCEP